MTRSVPEQLWSRLKFALETRSALPQGQATVVEIADYADRVTGVDDVSRFVRDYYLRRQFGESRGALTDEEAEAIVVDIEKRKRSGRPVSDSLAMASEAGTRVSVAAAESIAETAVAYGREEIDARFPIELTSLPRASLAARDDGIGSSKEVPATPVPPPAQNDAGNDTVRLARSRVNYLALVRSLLLGILEWWSVSRRGLRVLALGILMASPDVRILWFTVPLALAIYTVLRIAGLAIRLFFRYLWIIGLLAFLADGAYQFLDLHIARNLARPFWKAAIEAQAQARDAMARAEAAASKGDARGLCASRGYVYCSYSNGSSLAGQIPYGYRVYQEKDGTTYEGYWARAGKTGMGVIIKDDHISWEGRWHDGKTNGCAGVQHFYKAKAETVGTDYSDNMAPDCPLPPTNRMYKTTYHHHGASYHDYFAGYEIDEGGKTTITIYGGDHDPEGSLSDIDLPPDAHGK